LPFFLSFELVLKASSKLQKPKDDIS